MTEESLFELVLNTPDAERGALLDRECAGNPELRRRLDALLAAHAASQSVRCRTPSHRPDGPPAQRQVAGCRHDRV